MYVRSVVIGEMNRVDVGNGLKKLGTKRFVSLHGNLLSRMNLSATHVESKGKKHIPGDELVLLKCPP